MDPSQTTTAGADQAAKPKETFLRSSSLWAIEMLEKMGHVLFFNKEAAARLSDAEKNIEIEQLLWVHHKDNDEDEIEALVESGDWPAALKKFRRNPRMLWALAEIEPLMLEMRDYLASGVPLALADPAPATPEPTDAGAK